MDALVDQLDDAGQPRWLLRLVAALNRGRRPPSHPQHLEPHLVAEELLAWAQDDGRWDRRAAKDWYSLLGDVHDAWSKLGPRLTVLADVGADLQALRAVRAERSIVAADRPTVQAAARALETAFDRPGALSAAVEDLFEAAQRSTRPGSLDEETRWRFALLAAIGERQGHDWALIADRVRQAVQSSRARPLADCMNSVKVAVESHSGHGHSIVWLAVDHAHGWGQPNDTVIQIFDGDWLLPVLREWSGPREGVPAELAADPRRLPEACERFDEDADPREQLPIAFVRIDLGDGPVGGARERARETLELLLARASALQHGTTWKIRDVVLHFVDGELIFESSELIGDPDLYTRLDRRAVLHDRTATTITEQAQRLQAHLPVRDGRLHDALELSRWLASARAGAPPARLVLSGRIIEQAANWAAVQIPALIEEHLSWAWAVDRIGAELAKAGFHGVMRLSAAGVASSDEEVRRARKEIINEARGQMRLRTFAVLDRLDWLIEQHSPDTETGDYLRELRRRTGDAGAVLEWVDELRAELRVLNARAVRARNALVHGGPLIAETVVTVVGVQDNLSSHALEWVIDGLASERSLPEVFADRSRFYLDAIGRLQASGDPNVILSEMLRA